MIEKEVQIDMAPKIEAQIQTEEAETDFEKYLKEIREDDFKQFIASQHLTAQQKEIQNKCLKLRNIFRGTIDQFFKANSGQATSALLANLK